MMGQIAARASVAVLIAGMLLAGSAVAVAAGTASPPAPTVAELSAQIEALKKDLAALKDAQKPVELGQQMLELQIRHARLWFTGDNQNWVLAAFQLGELREALAAVVEANPDHETIQPERLADVLPMMTNPPIKALQAAIDKKDRAAFQAAYDQLTASCNACHTAHSFGFNQFQRPKTPFLDNQQYVPPKP